MNAQEARKLAESNNAFSIVIDKIKKAAAKGNFNVFLYYPPKEHIADTLAEYLEQLGYLVTRSYEYSKDKEVIGIRLEVSW